MGRSYQSDHAEELEMIELFYAGTPKKELMKKYGVDAKRFSLIKSRNQMILDFDEKLFIDILRDDYEKLRQVEFVNRYNIDSYQYGKLATKISITQTKLMKILDIMEIEFTGEVQRNDKSAKQNYDIVLYKKEEREARRKGSFEMTSAEKADYKEKLKIIESQVAYLDNLMHEKNIGAELRSRILSTSKVVAREAMLVGINSTKHGYGDKAQFEIMKKLGMV